MKENEFINHHVVDCENTVEWFNYFADYIEETNSNLYNEACEYADNKQEVLIKNENNGN